MTLLDIEHTHPSAFRHNRDFICVTTPDHQVVTLRIRDILHVTPGVIPTQAAVQHQTPLGWHSLTITEAARAFEERCQKLLDAIVRHDGESINQHFCPPRALL